MNKNIEKVKGREHSNLYYDIMFPLWNLYHRYILHIRGFNWFASCRHINPFDVLTPRRFERQIKNLKL
jgi:hypothetical protein